MTNRNRVRLSQLSLGLAIALAAAPAFAQNTTAVVGGRIVAADSQPVSGAQVTILHVPTGTTSTATTSADGRYAARGLRVGGPYTITVVKDGVSEVREGVYLQLAETTSVDAVLGEDTTTLAAVEVTGAAVTAEVFSADKMGTGTNVSRDQIDSLPSAGRNIQDYIRLDPRISQVSKADGAISAGGQNTRYNLIKIDGVSSSDPFGLESNNLPTERQPVSIDAIEAINVDVANYDTTIAGGTGAVVNAVTKSGTNEFGGSVYYTLRDGDWVREDLRGVTFNGFSEETTYGGTFGGPLIKDRLFFFVNYENYTRGDPGTGFSDTPFGRGLITPANVTAVQAAAAAYGFDAGGTAVSGDTNIEEFAVKIDLNITDDHRAALRYSSLEQNVLRFPQVDNNSISLSSFWYDLPKTFDTTVLELFSDWTENFSTEFKASYRTYDSVRVPLSNLPQIEIRGFGGNSSIFIGTEQNTHVNVLETEQVSLFGSGNLFVGDHAIKFGFDHESNDIFNYFGRNQNGTYTFNNLAAFVAGTPTNYVVRGPGPGRTYDDIPASYNQKNTGLFVQDSWSVNYNLTLMFGLRYDMPDFDDQPVFNALIDSTYGYDNTRTVDASLLQPRAGFNYTFDSDRPTQLRGGVGLFQGASPNVWVAGAYGNTGLSYTEYSLGGSGNPPVAPFTPNQPPFIPAGGAGRQNVDIIEPGFALPSTWKANLAFDHELPWYGTVFSAELLVTNVKDGIVIDRLDMFNSAGQGVTAVGPDGRELYWNARGLDPAFRDTFGITDGRNGVGNRFFRPAGVGDVFLLRNTSEGESQQLTVGLDKPMVDNWSWSFAYTYTAATDVTPLTSSQNSSNWGSTLIRNQGEDVAYDSRYAIKDRFTGSLQWKHNFFGDNETRVGMFYEGRSGRPFSYIFRNDANGDGGGFNDLFYVPNGPGDVIWTGGAAMEASFFAYLADNPELSAYQGQIAPANGFRTGFVNNFDVRVSQELPGFAEDHKAVLALDIMNIGNLLNEDWGVIEDYGFNSTQQLANYSGVCTATVTPLCPAGSQGRYVYTWTGPGTGPGVQENNNDKGNTGVSRWSVNLSIRYHI
ncbi:MAG: TonB-dependent receptor [Arenimonas sp.]|uniref:TonB-dependent receptor n=1 Tax=Arenimonas sp. TaxID=1872635 RepID=UPI0025BCD36B|nr:TonB-dependent receptor [Arenimonas sp.]MBW8369231.1 TonB-dependent receptor [Arenimonas sp.]